MAAASYVGLTEMIAAAEPEAMHRGHFLLFEQASLQEYHAVLHPIDLDFVDKSEDKLLGLIKRSSSAGQPGFYPIVPGYELKAQDLAKILEFMLQWAYFPQLDRAKIKRFEALYAKRMQQQEEDINVAKTQETEQIQRDWEQ